MPDSPVFTIIIPVYNTADYLPQCLDSLLSQTVRGFRVIMVDDGSTDGSGDIARGYVGRHPEVFALLAQENRGQGAARNLALRQVDTPYVTFLDSDDWWSLRTAERITARIRACDPDLVFTTPSVYDMTTRAFTEWRDNEAVRRAFAERGDVLSPEDAPELFSAEASVCRLVIRTEMLREHGFAFPEGMKWEDVAPRFMILGWAQSCALADDAGFVYRINSGHQTTAGSGRARLDIIPAYRIAFEYAEQNGWPDIRKAYIFDMFMQFVPWFLRETDRKVYPKLVRSLHAFSRELPGTYFDAWVRLLDPAPKTVAVWKGLRSGPVSALMRDPVRYDLMKRIARKFKRMVRR